MDKIFDSIRAERERQERLHGAFNDRHHALDYHFIAVILEELGEATQVLQYIKHQRDRDDLILDYRKELIETAASIVQTIQRLDAEYCLTITP